MLLVSCDPPFNQVPGRLSVLDAALVRPVQEEPAVRKTTERVLPVAQHDTAQPNQGIRQ